MAMKDHGAILHVDLESLVHHRCEFPPASLRNVGDSTQVPTCAWNNARRTEDLKTVGCQTLSSHLDIPKMIMDSSKKNGRCRKCALQKFSRLRAKYRFFFTHKARSFVLWPNQCTRNCHVNDYVYTIFTFWFFKLNTKLISFLY